MCLYSSCHDEIRIRSASISAFLPCTVPNVMIRKEPHIAIHIADAEVRCIRLILTQILVFGI